MMPKAGGQAQQENLPQLYSLTAAGNLARPMETIPVSYGRLKRILRLRFGVVERVRRR